MSGGYSLSVEMLLLRSNSYTAAKGWDDLANAFTESPKHSSLDEMILLLHAAIHGPHEKLSEYVRPVSYGWLDEVPKLLLSAAPSTLTGTAPAHQRRPHVEATTGARFFSNHDGQGQQKRIKDIPRERITDRKEGETVTSSGDHEENDETRVNAAKSIQDAYRRHLDRKRAGPARKIQAAYRRHLKRKSVVRKGMDAIQADYWNLLRERSVKMEWSKDSRYYLLFRVPLAYILVCLDTIGAFAESEKKGANKRMMTAGDKDFEELKEARNQYRWDNVDRTLY